MWSVLEKCTITLPAWIIHIGYWLVWATGVKWGCIPVLFFPGLGGKMCIEPLLWYCPSIVPIRGCSSEKQCHWSYHIYSRAGSLVLSENSFWSTSSICLNLFSINFKNNHFPLVSNWYRSCLGVCEGWMAGENFTRNKKSLVEECVSFPNALCFQISISLFIRDESLKSVKL